MNPNDNQASRPGFTPIGAHSTETPIAATVVARPAPTALGLTATMVMIQPVGQSINYTIDTAGTPPTAATLGFFVAAGDGVIIPIANGTILTIIENAAAPAATVQVQWGR